MESQIEIRFQDAIHSYWQVRDAQAEKQALTGRVDAGSRGAVTGGGHLNAVAVLLEQLFAEQGFPLSSIKRTSSIELPGYYRPTKRWDLVVMDQDNLVAAIELKSQVGPSFGNNFNNRTEEAIGNAVDVWRAYEAGTFGSVRPWLGYIFLLEETLKSTTPVRVARTAFPVEPVFYNTSYKDRYRIMCQRLVRERLYDAACFVTSSKEPGSPIDEPAPELSFTNFSAAIAGRAAFIHALNKQR